MKIKFLVITGLFLVVFLMRINNIFAQRMFPQITSVLPEYGKLDVDTQTTIEIDFNSEMDRKSVERKFRIFPKVDGKIYWEKNKLIFKADKPFCPSTFYFISLSADIKSAEGIPLILTYFVTVRQGLCVGTDEKIHIVSRIKDSPHILTEGKNPVWSFGNQSIIYDYQGEIWKIDADGKNKIQLTNDPSLMATNPVYGVSADVIAYLGMNCAGVSNIYTLDIKTNIVRQLTAFSEPGTVSYIRCSPGGLYLAFLREGHIWVVNQNGENLCKLTTGELICHKNFAWSPGGTKIAFAGDENIWVGDIYSTELEKISFNNLKTGMLDWSVNNKIVFETNGLTIMNADGSDEISIATGGKNPLWIKEDCLSFILPLFNEANTAQLWIMSADGLNKEKIAEIDLRCPYVSWSKDMGYADLFSP